MSDNQVEQELKSFDLETRVRELVLELVSPTIMKTEFSHNKIIKLKTAYINLKRKHEKLEHNVAKLYEKLQLLNTINAKLEAQERALKQSDIDMKLIIDKQQAQIDSVRYSVQQIREYFEKIEATTSEYKQDVANYNTNIKRSEDHLQNEIHKFVRYIENMIGDCKQMSKTSEVKSIDAQLSAENVSKQLPQIYADMQICQNQCRDLQQYIEKLELQYINKGQFSSLQSSLDSKFTQIHASLIKNSDEITDIQHFLVRDMPMKTQVQIGATLYSVLDAKIQANLANYEETKLQDIREMYKKLTLEHARSRLEAELGFAEQRRREIRSASAQRRPIKPQIKRPQTVTSEFIEAIPKLNLEGLITQIPNIQAAQNPDPEEQESPSELPNEFTQLIPQIQTIPDEELQNIYIRFDEIEEKVTQMESAAKLHLEQAGSKIEIMDNMLSVFQTEQSYQSKHIVQDKNDIIYKYQQLLDQFKKTEDKIQVSQDMIVNIGEFCACLHEALKIV